MKSPSPIEQRNMTSHTDETRPSMTPKKPRPFPKLDNHVWGAKINLSREEQWDIRDLEAGIEVISVLDLGLDPKQAPDAPYNKYLSLTHHKHLAMLHGVIASPSAATRRNMRALHYAISEVGYEVDEQVSVHEAKIRPAKLKIIELFEKEAANLSIKDMKILILYMQSFLEGMKAVYHWDKDCVEGDHP